MINRMNIRLFYQLAKNQAGYSLCLNEIRTNPQDADWRCAATPKGCAPGMVHIKNLAANLERSPLTHSYGYGSAGDRPTLFDRGVPKQRVPAPRPCGAALKRVQNRSWRFCARFPLSFVPFMQYSG